MSIIMFINVSVSKNLYNYSIQKAYRSEKHTYFIITYVRR